MTTLETLQDVVHALELRAWLRNKCVEIRSVGETDQRTVERAIQAIVTLALVRNVVEPPSFNEPPSRTMGAAELLRKILRHPEESMQALDRVEQEERERRKAG